MIDFELVDPYPLLRKAKQDRETRRNWPLVGRASDRVARNIVPQLYQGHRRARDWGKEWCSAKYQRGKSHGDVMMRHCHAVDYALLYDYPNGGTNPLLSASIEVIARDIYGLFQMYRHVTSPEDLKPKGKEKKSKVKPGARAKYDVVQMYGGQAELLAPDADASAYKQEKYDLAAERLGAQGGDAAEDA